MKEIKPGYFQFGINEMPEFQSAYPGTLFVAYICDRHKCSECHSECEHTTNYEHAAFRGRIQTFQKLSSWKYIEVRDYYEHRETVCTCQDQSFLMPCT